MKKTIFATLLTLVAIVANGQGTVEFQNLGVAGSGEVVDAPINNGLTGMPAGPEIVAGLYYAPGTDPAAVDPATMIKLGANSELGGGYFFGGNRTTPSSTVPNGIAVFEVRAWSSAFSTFEDAVSMGNPSSHVAGRSGLFANPTGGGGQPPALPQQLVFNGFTANPVPEPSAIALALLGIGSLFLLRRRK